MSKEFQASYEGPCSLCGTMIYKKDWCHFVNHKIAHLECHLPDGSDLVSEDYEPVARPESFTVRGKRKTPYCPTCFTYHNGECP